MKRTSRLLASAGTALVALPVLLTGAPADASPGQQVTDASATTAAALAASLVGDGIEVAGARISGAPEAIGSVTGMSALGIDAGVALSTGRVASLPGPHADTDGSTAFGAPGDPDIESLVGARTVDAAALEFDFRPTTASVAFTYVFGSMEYPEWVDKSFNDAFAFLIDGTNCAVIDGTPVSVNSINDHANADHYVENAAGTADTTLDGFTTPLTCAATVRPGEWNHAKLVIADVVDALFDSSVLIAAHSFRANSAPTASDLTLSVVSGTSLSIAFHGDDADGDPLTYEVVSAPVHGDLEQNADGALYTPAPAFLGTDGFVYRVSDGITASRAYSASITVTPAEAVPAPTAPTTPTPSKPTPTPSTPTPSTPTPTPSTTTTTPATPPATTPKNPAQTVPGPVQTPPAPAPAPGDLRPPVKDAPPAGGDSPDATHGSQATRRPGATAPTSKLAATGADGDASAAQTGALLGAIATLAGGTAALLTARRRRESGNPSRGVHLSPRRTQN